MLSELGLQSDVTVLHNGSQNYVAWFPDNSLAVFEYTELTCLAKNKDYATNNNTYKALKGRVNDFVTMIHNSVTFGQIRIQTVRDVIDGWPLVVVK